MLAPGTHVGDRRGQIGSQFALDVQVPLHQIVALWIVLDVTLTQLAKGLQARKCCRWECSRGQTSRPSLLCERSRTEGRKSVLVYERKNIKYAEAATNRGLLVSKRVPSETDSRLKVTEGRVLKEWVAQMWGCGRETPHVGQLSVGFRRNRGHLIAQPQIQCEVRPPSKIVLQVQPEDVLVIIPGAMFRQKSCRQCVGHVGQEVLQGSKGVLAAVGVVLNHAGDQVFEGKAKFQNMLAPGQKSVVIPLIGSE